MIFSQNKLDNRKTRAIIGVYRGKHFLKGYHMKLETVPQNVVVNGEFTTSEFAVGDVAFIVDMFSNRVYSHKERAVIRELACNAHDSHIMAGTQHIPFKVHLPTMLEPYLAIRDYGTGLSDHQVRNVFAGIGISTKRESNEMIGCFGIGSLSPYSISDSFMVRSYYNGSLRTYTCYRDEHRKPVVALLTMEDTDEPNGLEVNVSISSSKTHEFPNEAVYVFTFWEGTTPDINNASVMKRCQEARNEFVLKGKDFGLSSGYGTLRAVMGNIAYAVPYELNPHHYDGYIKFELGELEFDTGRENLAMTTKVREALRTKIEEVRRQIHDIAVEQIKALPTPFQRARLAEKLNAGQLGKLAQLKWVDFALPETTDVIEFWTLAYRVVQKSETKQLPISQKCEYYPYTPRMAQRIRAYIKDSGKTVVMLTPKQIVECQIDLDVIRDINQIPKIERESSNRNFTSKVKTFEFRYNHQYSGYSGRVRKNANHFSECEIDVDDNQERVYIEIKGFQPTEDTCLELSEIHSMTKVLATTGVTVPVIYGVKTAYTKTTEFENGNWITVRDYLRREFAKMSDKGVYVYDSTNFDKLQALAGKITSEELTEWAEYAILAKTQSDLDLDALTGIFQRLRIEYKKDKTINDWMQQYMAKYPILTILSDWEITHGKNPSYIAPYISGVVKNASTNS